MARIFFSLAVFSLLLLGANLWVGLAKTGDFNGAAARLSEAEREVRLSRGLGDSQDQQLEQARQAAREQFAPLRRWATVHVLLGLGASLVAVLVNSITVTYFVGTSRWCLEWGETYQLDKELTAESTRLKRKAFPWSVVGILAILVVVALGAASDPSGLGAQSSAGWVSYHYIAAVLGIAVVAYAFYRQLLAVYANFEVIERIMAEVRRIREAKGLE